MLQLLQMKFFFCKPGAHRLFLQDNEILIHVWQHVDIRTFLEKALKGKGAFTVPICQLDVSCSQTACVLFT